MDRSSLWLCILIFFARICDVSLGTLRVIMVTQGRRVLAAGLGFFEILIWILAVSRVMSGARHPGLIIAYAAGFACGNFIGLTIERWVAFGHQVVRVFSRQGEEIAEKLRTLGFRVTLFEGRGRDGPVHSTYTETERREVPRLLETARAIDPSCYYVIDDIRIASSVNGSPPRRGFMIRLRK